MFRRQSQDRILSLAFLPAYVRSIVMAMEPELCVENFDDAVDAVSKANIFSSSS